MDLVLYNFMITQHGKLNLKLFLQLGIAIVMIFFATNIFAIQHIALKDMVASITNQYESLGKMVVAIAYLSGLGFVFSSIYKFKQHKDNPTQIPIGGPLALLAVGILLMFMPGFIKPAGKSMFGSNADLNQIAGGFTGESAKYLPGGSEGQ